MTAKTKKRKVWYGVWNKEKKCWTSQTGGVYVFGTKGMMENYPTEVGEDMESIEEIRPCYLPQPLPKRRKR